MYAYHFREWLVFFYFYCIFGWCFESTYVSIKEHHLVNRGFLHGPWLPIYGSGAIAVLWLTLPFQKTPALVFLVGMIGATILEFFTGEALVRMFHVRYWDYSNQKIQYKGHICLSSSIAWGFLSLFMVYVIHEPVEHLILLLNEDVISVLTFSITVAFVYDFSVAFRKAMDLRDLLIQAEQLRAQLGEKAVEKYRVLESAAVFAKEAVENELDERLEAIQETGEQLQNKLRQGAMRGKEAIQNLELEQRLLRRLDGVKAQMEKSAAYVAARNPGFRLVTQSDVADEIREKMKKYKNGKAQ